MDFHTIVYSENEACLVDAKVRQPHAAASEIAPRARLPCLSLCLSFTSSEFLARIVFLFISYQKSKDENVTSW